LGVVIEGEVVGARKDDVLAVRVDIMDQLVLSFSPCLIYVREKGRREREKEREREREREREAGKDVVDDGADIDQCSHLA
jgi:hypothetical protein